jgi:diguanylate cyclase (GGDEF)-like protein
LAEAELKRAGRYGRPLTAVYIDLDNFKNVNDAFGHEVGNSLLRIVAATLAANVRSSDVVARLGGDEFAIVLAETNVSSAKAYLKKAQGQLLEVMKDNNWNVTFSIGAVTFTHPPKSVDDMVKQADDLMYSAKRQGRNNLLHQVSDSVNG